MEIGLRRPVLTCAVAAVALAAWSASCGGNKKQAGGDGGTPSTACRNSLDCPVTMVCDTAIAMCVDCVSANDCPANNDCTARKCVPYVTCKNSLDCPAAVVCDVASGRCVACVTDADCADATKVCVASACRTKCMSDRTCTPLGLLCDSATGSCVRCLKSQDCGSGQYCQGGTCMAAVCTPGQTTCMLNAVATCNAVGDGYAGTAVPCDPKTCAMSASGAACVDATVDGGAGTGGGSGAGGAGGASGAGGGSGAGGASGASGTGGATGASGAGGATGASGAGGATGASGAGGATGVGGASGVGGATGVGGASGAGGAAGAGGVSGAGGTGSCGLLIDDMEANTGFICRGDGRIGHWFTYNDKYPATVQTPPQGTVPVLPERIVPPRGTSQFAMHTYGTFGADMAIGCSLNGSESQVPEVVHPYDVSRFTGIRFYAKGTPATPMLQAIVQTTGTQISGMANRVYITLDPTNWTLYQIPFATLTGGLGAFTPKDAVTIEFLVYNNTGAATLSANFWIDDLSFY